eukprot:CAMPEP_0119259718 /NCGR_PEP_ID=MMETSP1329-20130426/427_1 /TAXON_ID=114041 /ORGANISM="Genus nov. species nov., Strain RCC1024" /LENGTH=313 /DNA_ID=CAMNT_0007259117 /DNA_START=225 /DNA_END=1162 /DNA_ORIENTATION=+
MAPPPYEVPARWTNAIGDGLLCAVHLVFLWRVLRRPARGSEAKELRFCVVAYCLCLVAFQGLGVVMHLYSPDHAVLDAFWFLYIVSGCLSPCSYGAALTLDQVRGPWRRPAAALWFVAGFAYIALASQQVVLTDYVPLPNILYLPLPAIIAKLFAGAPWMPAAMKMNGVTDLDAGLTLSFDGRGYAATPFPLIFDPSYAGATDLVASFPDWRTESLGTLMLCFGVGANFVHLYLCLKGSKDCAAAPARRARAASCVGAHRGMCFALVSMPPAMLLGGVRCGIDLMHAAAAPGMYLQVKAVSDAIFEADEAAAG